MPVTHMMHGSECQPQGSYQFYDPSWDDCSSQYQQPFVSYAYPNPTASSSMHSPTYDSTYAAPTNNGVDEGSNSDDDYCPPRATKRKRKAAVPAIDEPVSKRAMRRAEIAAEAGSVGAKDVPKGRTRATAQGGWEWWDPRWMKWRPAAPHDTFRHSFIAQDSVIGQYLITPESGLSSSDVTSIATEQHQLYWNFHDRASWGNILDHAGNEVMYAVEKPVTNDPILPEPGQYMIYNGLIMLDPDDHPIRDYPGAPRTLSSKVEAGRIEALRRVFGMQLYDIRARMPRTIKKKDGERYRLYGPSCLNQRCSRWRDEYLVMAWREGKRKNDVRNFLGAPKVISTKGLRPLTKYQVEQLREADRGKHLERANGRNISKQERASRDRAHKKRLQRLKQQDGLDEVRRHAEPGVQLSQENVTAPPTQFGANAHFGAEPFTSQNVDYATHRAGCAMTTDRMRESDSPQHTVNRSSSPSYFQHRTTPSRIVDPIRANSETSHSLTPPMGYEQQQDKIAPPPQSQQGDHLASNPLTLLQVTPKTENQPSTPNGIRHGQPMSFNEQLAIKTALFPTRLHYFQLAGEQAPETLNHMSYNLQHKQLQLSLNSAWRRRHKVNLPPLLHSISEWHGEWSSLPIPVIAEEVAKGLMDNIGETRDATAARDSAEEAIETEGSELPVDAERSIGLLGVGARFTGEDLDLLRDLFEEEVESGEDEGGSVGPPWSGKGTNLL